MIVKLSQDYSIVICGAAGQGIETVEHILIQTLKKSGYYVFATREYMSRVRGGENSTSIRVSSKPIRAFKERIDILFPLVKKAYSHLKNRITLDTLLIGEDQFINECKEGGCREIEVPFLELAKELGSKVYSNIISLGVICGLLNAEISVLDELLKDRFRKKGVKVIQNNIKAARMGYDIAIKILNEGTLNRKYPLIKDEKIVNDYILNGRDALALGAIAGGVNYITFYPMAPATEVGTILSQHALEFSMIVDQSEDELSVVNKAIGASYVGARSFVLTSGGGFSLMSEGVSLAGMMELPIIFLVGQRPSPATGMPTRTAQEDLNLVLNAGAGFFPRIVFAPGTIEKAFAIIQNAFNLTQEFQVPIFILADQYIMDSFYNISSLNIEERKINKYFIETKKDYMRYAFTENGISPRGVPGYGDGLVDADSHTHTEDGNISEDPLIRMKNVEKRLKKLELIKEVILKPEFIGAEDYEILIIGWGSNYYLIKEALEIIKDERISFLFFDQLYPLHPDVNEYVKRAKNTIVIENNPNRQFAKVVELETHRGLDSILNYSGYTFSVEQLENEIKSHIEEI